jgi:hypothetical protein
MDWNAQVDVYVLAHFYEIAIPLMIAVVMIALGINRSARNAYRKRMKGGN